jgi:hypothetical protein
VIAAGCDVHVLDGHVAAEDVGHGDGGDARDGVADGGLEHGGNARTPHLPTETTGGEGLDVHSTGAAVDGDAVEGDLVMQDAVGHVARTGHDDRGKHLARSRAGGAAAGGQRQQYAHSDSDSVRSPAPLTRPPPCTAHSHQELVSVVVSVVPGAMPPSVLLPSVEVVSEDERDDGGLDVPSRCRSTPQVLVV